MYMEGAQLRMAAGDIWCSAGQWYHTVGFATYFLYLSKLQIVFFQIAKCISSNGCRRYIALSGAKISYSWLCNVFFLSSKSVICSDRWKDIINVITLKKFRLLVLKWVRMIKIHSLYILFTFSSLCLGDIFQEFMFSLDNLSKGPVYQCSVLSDYT